MMKKIQSCFHSCQAQNAGLLALRIALGIIFVYHGYGKLTAIAGTTGFFSSLGIPMPGIAAYVVGLVELVGGAAILLGILTHWAALFLSITMIVALLTAHLGGPFKSAELAIAVLGGSLALLGTGPGRWSLMRSCCDTDDGCGSCCEKPDEDSGCCGGGCSTDHTPAPTSEKK